jgi:hypothetical protein
MNFISTLLTQVKNKMNGNPPGKIRKDDLEALGDIAQYIGEGLTDIVQSTTPGDRRNLFKNGNPDPRVVFTKAIGNDGRLAPNPRPGGVNVHHQPMASTESPIIQQSGGKPTIPEIPRSALPLTNEQLARLLEEESRIGVEAEAEVEVPESDNTYYPPRRQVERILSLSEHTSESNHKPLDNQMEFNFVKQVIQNFGNVGDVIRHFDERLDNIETSIKLINAFMSNIRETMQFVKSNMHQKRIAKKIKGQDNEFKAIT